MYEPRYCTARHSAVSSIGGRIIRAFLYRFGADLTGGRIRPVVDRVVPLDKVADAHRAMAAGEIFGKLILKVG